MATNRIYYLLKKYIARSINAKEEQELLDLYRGIASEDNEYPDEKEMVRERMLHRLQKEILFKKRNTAFIRFWKVAAVAATVFFSVAIYMASRPVFNSEKIVKRKVVKPAPILPGTNVAVLTLGNGERILLNSSAKGKLAVQGNTTITKDADGQVTYQINNDNTALHQPVTYNTITTPPGGQFKIILPDGSDVWLNAASSLKYPNRFEGGKRHVELHGEAYFEIHKDKSAPFTVTAENTNIRVLGTHFNVMAYQNEPAVKTTLLEGSVSLYSKNSHKVLVPGQQAMVSKIEDNITLSIVNVDDAVAWKNGYFSFRKENIKTVMNKISRWYNVDVEYKGNVNNKTMGGTVSRAESIEELLNYLELTGIAKFKIEGRRIIVICK